MSRKKHNKTNKQKEIPKSKISSGTIVVLSFLGLIFLYGVFVAFGPEQGNNINLDADLDDFVECLLESDAIFYGTEWCGFCNQQKQVLGDVFRQFSNNFYVDCDRESARCSNAGITGYPTWIINNRPYVGVQSIEQLSAAMNCQF